MLLIFIEDMLEINSSMRSDDDDEIYLLVQHRLFNIKKQLQIGTYQLNQIQSIPLITYITTSGNRIFLIAF